MYDCNWSEIFVALTYLFIQDKGLNITVYYTNYMSSFGSHGGGAQSMAGCKRPSATWTCLIP